MKRKFVIRQPISKKAKVIASLLSIALLVCFYEALSYRQHKINPTDTTIPSLTQMTKAFIVVCTPDSNGRIWLVEDAIATFTRHALGLGTGVILSVIVGIAMGCFPLVEHFFLPPLSFLAKLPPTAMLAVFFVIVGMDLTMFITMIAFGVFPTLTQAIYQSAKFDVHEELVHKTYTLGGSNFETIFNFVFQLVLPRIIEAIRLQVGPAMVYLIAAEWMLGDVGFGYRLRIQSRLLNMAIVYDYIILLGVIGFMMDGTLTWFRKLVCPWFEEGEA